MGHVHLRTQKPLIAVVALLCVTTGERPARAVRAQSVDSRSAQRLALSGDGRWAATARTVMRGSTSAQVITAHDTRNNTAVQTITVPGDRLAALELSADGRHVLVVHALALARDAWETAQIFNTTTGTEVARWEHHNDGGHWCHFTGDGRAVVVAGADSTLVLRDVEGKKPSVEFTGFHASINAVSLSDDDAYLIAGGDDGRVRVWKTQAGELIHTLVAGKGRVRSVSISRDNQYVIAGSEKGTVNVWRLGSSEPPVDIANPAAVRSAMMSPDNSFLAIGTERTLTMLPLRGNGTKWVKATGSPVEDISFSSNSMMVMARDQQPHVYEAATGREPPPEQGVTYSAVQFAHSAPVMVYASSLGEFVYDLTNRRRIALSPADASGSKQLVR